MKVTTTLENTGNPFMLELELGPILSSNSDRRLAEVNSKWVKVRVFCNHAQLRQRLKCLF
jgi:hypothetical protein